MDPRQKDLQEEFTQRFQRLPVVVQNAITSADVSKHLRELADGHKLHLDQWQKLENEVMLVLLGFEPMDNLIPNIIKEVGVDGATAFALGEDISRTVFEPVRAELERKLDHPDATAKVLTETEQARESILAAKQAAPTEPTTVPTPVAATTAPIAPATPPTPAPAGKVERAPVSSSYNPSVPSHERKGIEGDPYREMPV